MVPPGNVSRLFPCPAEAPRLRTSLQHQAIQRGGTLNLVSHLLITPVETNPIDSLQGNKNCNHACLTPVETNPIVSLQGNKDCNRACLIVVSVSPQESIFRV